MNQIDTTGVPPVYVFLARWGLIVALLILLAAMLWVGKITSDVGLPLILTIVAAAGINPVGPTTPPVTLHVHAAGESTPILALPAVPAAPVPAAPEH